MNIHNDHFSAAMKVRKFARSTFRMAGESVRDEEETERRTRAAENFSDRSQLLRQRESITKAGALAMMQW
jgi:hypothetical protein